MRRDPDCPYCRRYGRACGRDHAELRAINEAINNTRNDNEWREPSDPDDEIEEPDQWGRTPDWNWPRGWGDRNA